MTQRVGPQPGPQTAFSSSTADIAIYGGSAGGGKTFALALEAARYATMPDYHAVIFRRFSTELRGGGGIWDESRRLYPALRGVPVESPTLEWTFPSRSTVEFLSLPHVHNVHKHQSKQYSFIGFDELTSFDAQQFWYMLTRLRSVGAAPKRLRGTCNPDPDSFVRSLVDWWIDEDGMAIDARSGVVRWFVRLDEQLHWGASSAEVVAHDPYRVLPRGAYREPGDVRAEPMSFTFIRARVSDNQVLMRQDPGYLARLNLMPGAQAKRLRDGNWDARDASGDYFDRSWTRIIDLPDPKTVVRRIRFWDKAATSPSDKNPDPDWTRGWRVALLNTGYYVAEDRQSLRAGPAEVEELIRQTADMDGPDVEVGAWQDPGQAGVVDIERMKTVLIDRTFRPIRAVRDKRAYASVWTPMAKNGRLLFVRRDYLPEVFATLEGFPLRRHDDDTDALSGCFQVLIGGAFEFDYLAAGDDRHGGGEVRDAWAELDSENDDDDAPRRLGRGACF